MKDIKDRIRELREVNGLTRVEMAQKLSVNKSSITRYETGEMKPTLDIMILMHNIFGVSLDWLAGLDNGESIKYDMLIKECVESGITHEKLKKAIEFIKEI
jgi:transcriptional regulator with XRE-family HTH domain